MKTRGRCLLADRTMRDLRCRARLNSSLCLNTSGRLRLVLLCHNCLARRVAPPRADATRDSTSRAWVAGSLAVVARVRAGRQCATLAGAASPGTSAPDTRKARPSRRAVPFRARSGAERATRPHCIRVPAREQIPAPLRHRPRDHSSGTGPATAPNSPTLTTGSVRKNSVMRHFPGTSRRPTPINLI